MNRRLTYTAAAMLAGLLAGLAFAQAPAAEKTPSFDSSRVGIEAKETKLSEVVGALARASGNAPLVLADNLRDRTVTLSVKDLPYWQALDELSRAAHAVYTPEWGKCALRLDPAARLEDFGAYSGPVVVKVHEIRHLAEFRVVRKDWTPDELSLTLQYFYEDRLPVIRAAGEIVEVRDAGYNRVVKSPVPEPTPFRVTFPRGERPPAGTVSVYLARVPNGAKLSEIEGVVRLELGIGAKRLTIRDALAQPGQSASADDLTVTTRRTGRARDAVTVAADVELTGPRALLLADSQSPRYGFALEGPDGKRYPGSIERMVRDLHAGPKADATEKKTPLVGKVELELRFAKANDAAGALSLTYTYPERLETREYAFKVKDVPIP